MRAGTVHGRGDHGGAARSSDVAREQPARGEVQRRLDREPVRTDAVEPEPAEAEADGGPRRIEVELDGERHTLPWPRRRRLLDVLRDAGLDAPFSCREGRCSACACMKLDGEVKMVHNEVLDDADLADGYILACQSLPVSDKLVDQLRLGSPPCPSIPRSPSARRCRPVPFAWTSSDVLLYHLALGATDLRYAYERDLRVLPTFGVGRADVPRRPTRPPCRCPGSRSTSPTCCTADRNSTCTGRSRPRARRSPRRGSPTCWTRAGRAVIVQETAVDVADGRSTVDRPVDHLRPWRGRFRRSRAARRSGSTCPTASRTTRSARRRCRSRRCGTGCAATATRCTPTRTSPHGRFPGADPARAVHLRHGVPDHGRARLLDGDADRATGSRRGSRAWCTRARRCAPGCGATDDSYLATTTAAERDDAPVLAGVRLTTKG